MNSSLCCKIALQNEEIAKSRSLITRILRQTLNSHTYLMFVAGITEYCPDEFRPLGCQRDQKCNGRIFTTGNIHDMANIIVWSFFAIYHGLAGCRRQRK